MLCCARARGTLTTTQQFEKRVYVNTFYQHHLEMYVMCCYVMCPVLEVDLLFYLLFLLFIRLCQIVSPASARERLSKHRRETAGKAWPVLRSAAMPCILPSPCLHKPLGLSFCSLCLLSLFSFSLSRDPSLVVTATRRETQTHQTTFQQPGWSPHVHAIHVLPHAAPSRYLLRPHSPFA